MRRNGQVKILVVDDLAAQRMALAAALEELDEDVITVSSGADALRLLLDHDVAVILLDVNMPDMDGFETAALIRQRPRTRHTPIIFLTGDTDEMLQPRAYALGAVDFILNPFLPDILRAKVRVFVELSKLHERVRREAEQRVALSQAQAAPRRGRGGESPAGLPRRDRGHPGAIARYADHGPRAAGAVRPPARRSGGGGPGRWRRALRPGGWPRRRGSFATPQGRTRCGSPSRDRSDAPLPRGDPGSSSEPTPLCVEWSCRWWPAGALWARWQRR